MRGNEAPQVRLFSYVHLEDRKPLRHPLRLVRRMVDQALAGLDGAFATMYATTGRPSIPPEWLLRALLLQIFYSIGSKAPLVDQLDDNLLFRWFVGLAIDDPVWDPSTFRKTWDRLIEADLAQGLFDQVLTQAAAKDLLFDEHFSVDGTLLEAWPRRRVSSARTAAPRRRPRRATARPISTASAGPTRPISHRRGGRRWASPRSPRALVDPLRTFR